MLPLSQILHTSSQLAMALNFRRRAKRLLTLPGKTQGRIRHLAWSRGFVTHEFPGPHPARSAPSAYRPARPGSFASVSPGLPFLRGHVPLLSLQSNTNPGMTSGVHPKIKKTWATACRLQIFKWHSSHVEQQSVLLELVNCHAEEM